MWLRPYLLAELLQVGDDAVAQAAVHGVRYEVGRAHHPHGLLQRLAEGEREHCRPMSDTREL